MTTPLIPVSIASTYAVGGKPVPLPAQLAWATPDMAGALTALATDIAQAGGELRLSDLFRSRAAQQAAHADWASGRKRAYSPPPGGSMHEAGRACDIDLAAIAMPLDRFWRLAAAHGLVPIVSRPDSRLSEAWHFELRGSHALVRSHYLAARGRNFSSPAAAMAASAVLAIGVPVDRFGANQQAAAIQSALIRLGHDIGDIDGVAGPRTGAALAALGLGGKDQDAQRTALETMLAPRFPGEAAQAGEPAPMLVKSR